jgi:hypothetical protein
MVSGMLAGLRVGRPRSARGVLEASDRNITYRATTT